MMSGEAVWTAAPTDIHLGSDDLHVWRAALNQPPPVVSACRALLSPDELNRAAKYRFAKHRDHFTVSRAVLRTLLGRYLRAEPARLRFSYSPYGKPSLSAADSETLRFNLSDSGELVLYAFTRDREVGVDLEYVRHDFEVEEIAQRFFSRAEVAALGALPAKLKAEGFFRCWTRKEAYIKARGEGLSLPLDQFDVSLSPGEPAALLRVANNPLELSRWSMRELNAGQGYIAALVVEGRDSQLSCFQWSETSPAAKA
jgi:4'-phosphopantetheinyl transferase